MKNLGPVTTFLGMHISQGINHISLDMTNCIMAAVSALGNSTFNSVYTPMGNIKPFFEVDSPPVSDTTYYKV